MKKYLLMAAFVFLMSLQIVSAMPVMQNVTVQPSNSWVGENVSISLSCYDDVNNSISQVYADITGPSIVLPRLYFTGYGTYQLTVSKDYLDRTGQYDVMVYCKNDLSETSSQGTSFTISRLSGYINDINPSPAYVGDDIEMDFVLEKDGVRISSGVVFNISMNDVMQNLKVLPAYDSTRGWILKLNSPGSAGIYNINVNAVYNGTNVSDSETVDIENSVEIEIVSIDKTWIKSRDNITVKLKALERGSVIELDDNIIDIAIGSSNAEITDISRQGDDFVVKITAPTLSPGRHNLEAYLNYKGHSYVDSKPIDYVVEIEGSIVDLENKAISTQMKFIQGGVTKLEISNDAYGYYSGSVPLGTYDVEIKFPKSKITLSNVLINEFDDPISYFYGDNFEIPGFRNAGLYSYDIDLSYLDAEIEMDYNEKNIVDENNLIVFKCSEWNSGKKVCNDEWVLIGYDLDTIRNNVKITTSDLSAFVIAEVKDLVVDFSFDKDVYNLKDKIKISGIVKDDAGNTVSNASVNVYIKNTPKSSDVVSDNNGVFSVEFDVPGNVGTYTVVLKAEKDPYNDFKEERSFQVVKSKSIYIDFLDSIKIQRGESLRQEFSIINDGQADIEGLSISLEGIPEAYYDITTGSVDLEAGQEKTFYINFNIPVYADTGITSATLKVDNDDISEEKIFGLNIAEKSQGEEVQPTGLATGFNLPNITYLEVVYIIIFAVSCFSIAILFKKIKLRRNRGVIRNLMFSAKKTLITKESPVKNTSTYDKLIITEFPNVLKFSKDLTKTKKGDE